MSADPAAADWRTADSYGELLLSDRRCFAWEWLRRSPVYRGLWAVRDTLADNASTRMGLHAWIDPSLATPEARPIWIIGTDPKVLDGRPVVDSGPRDEQFDIRAFAPFVSVEVDAEHTEHWLLSDGHWAIRLDLHDGTLLGGPVLLEHRMSGVRSSRPKLEALSQLLALSEKGRLPRSMIPHERRAAQWILELRAADALLAGATQQEMARTLFEAAMAARRWRLENDSYRLRVQRLVRIARRRLSDPLGGPWFR